MQKPFIKLLFKLLSISFIFPKLCIMFIEPIISVERRGWIEVICGAMFSGKTEELIRRLKRAKIANLKVEIFKPSIDVRYSELHVISHDSNAIHSTPVDSVQELLQCVNNVDVVG